MDQKPVPQGVPVQNPPQPAGQYFSPQIPGGAAATGQGQWSTGLCGCCEDPGSACMTCFCPCITFGRNAEIIDRGTTSCVFSGLVFYALAHFWCSCLYSFTYRSKIRGLYSLPEDPCADFCVHWCCPCCAIAQEYRELKNRGIDPSMGWIANADKMNQYGTTAAPNLAPGMQR